MNFLWEIHLIFAIGLFIIGTVVGSFLNVVIYRIPWEKSVMWPASRCPKCLSEIQARDNIPILGWILLGGSCRNCKLKISARYPGVELLVGLLFAAVYYSDGVLNQRFGMTDFKLAMTVLYHCLLVASLVAVTFIDYDLMIVPGEITTPGIVIGIAMGALFPWVRSTPSEAQTMLEGLKFGVIGAVTGAAIVGVVRVVFGFILRREAMGAGDIHILAMIGAFLGWQAVVCTFFLAPFFGFLPSIAKILVILAKFLTGSKIKAADRELPFGPYLSMAAVTLMLTWPIFWDKFAKVYFETYPKLFWFLIGQDRLVD